MIGKSPDGLIGLVHPPCEVMLMQKDLSPAMITGLPLSLQVATCTEEGLPEGIISLRPVIGKLMNSFISISVIFLC